jgi:hypothetical protein
MKTRDEIVNEPKATKNLTDYKRNRNHKQSKALSKIVRDKDTNRYR